MSRDRPSSAPSVEADLERFERRMRRRFAVFQTWIERHFETGTPVGTLHGLKVMVERTAASYESELRSLKAKVEALKPTDLRHRP